MKSKRKRKPDEVWCRAGAVWFLLWAATSAVGCSRPTAEEVGQTPAQSVDERPVIVFLGDSLTAGYQLDPAEAYPALIQQKLNQAGYAFRVVNAGVSGSTTTDGLQRLNWLLREPIDILVLALGANDALRGLPLSLIRDNLDAILTRVRGQNPGAQLVLVGMRMPPSYGGVYVLGFEAIYRELAQAHGAVLIPFLLEGVAGEPGLNLADQLHPNAAGHRVLARTVWSYVKPLTVP